MILRHDHINFWTILFLFGALHRIRDTVASMGVHIYRYPYVDYAQRTWSEWTAWSACSRTCGGGIRVRSRTCRSRLTAHGSYHRACSGDTTEYDLCSKMDCTSSGNFLADQCSRYNKNVISGRRVQEWIPKEAGKNPCELQCMAKDRSVAYSFGKVIDGTKCTVSGQSEKHICVNGRCTMIDCAGHLGTDNRRDICGVCRGDNSTCFRHVDTYWRRPRERNDYEGIKDKHYDYNEIVLIPSGATQISVSENSDTNFLALVDHQGNFEINGNWRIQSPGKYNSQGTEFQYNRTWYGREELVAAGPTSYDFLVFVLGTGDIPTVHYEYWLSRNALKSSTRPLLHSLSQIAKPESFWKPESISPPENHNDKTSTTAKIQGYRSFYHRNEILKSVPSWSLKRHRFLSKNIARIYLEQFETPTSLDRERSGTTRSDHTHVSYGRHSNSTLRKIGDGPRPEVRSQKATIVSPYASERLNASSVLSLAHRKTSVYLVEEKQPKVLFSEEIGKGKKGKGRTTVPSTEATNINAMRASKKKRNKKSSRGECQPCPKPKHQTKNFCSSEFILRAIILASEKQQYGFRYELQVVQSYKNTVPIMPREYLWNSDTCRCPRLHVGREYIVMGQSGDYGAKTRESRLYVSRNSFVKRYSQKRARTMLRLVRDQDSVCKQFV